MKRKQSQKSFLPLPWQKLQPLGELAVLLCALATIFTPLLDGSQVIAGMDFLNLLLPQITYAREVLAKGFVPLWNWYTWGGSPLLAAWQSALFYPPTWASMLVGLPYGLQISIFLHLLIAAWGAKRLSERLLGTERWGGTFAGLVYSGSGFFLGHIEQINSVAALAWTPWLLEAFFRVVTRREGGVLLCVVTLLGLLAGHPQHLQLALFFAWVSAFVMMAAFSLSRASCRWGRGMGMAVIAMMVGALASAPQLFPALELAEWSERVWPYDNPYAPNFRWQHVAAFIVPRFFNRLAGTNGQPVGYTEEGVYCGMLPLVLAGVYGWFGLRKTIRERQAFSLWALLLIVAFLFSLGPEGGIAPLVVQIVPGFEKFRGTARALNIVVLMLACGAGAAYSILAERSSRAVAFVTFCGVFGVTTLDLAWTHRPELTSLFVPLEVLEAEKPMLSTKPSPQSPSRTYRFMAHDSDLYLDHRSGAVAERFIRLQPNLNLFHHVALVDGYEEGLLPAWPYGNFLRRLNRNLRHETLDAPLLALMGVNYVISEYPAEFASQYWERVGTTQPRRLTNTSYSLWKNRIPAAWFYDWETLVALGISSHTVQKTTIEELLLPERDSSGQPLRVPAGRVIVDHVLSESALTGFSDAAEKTPLKVRSIAPNSLLLQARTQSPRNVVYSGVLCSGWKWGFDDQGFLPIRYEGTFRPFAVVTLPAKRLPPAMWWRYAPFSYRLGAFVGLLALMFLAAHSLARRPESMQSAVDERSIAQVTENHA